MQLKKKTEEKYYQKCGFFFLILEPILNYRAKRKKSCVELS